MKRILLVCLLFLFLPLLQVHAGDGLVGVMDPCIKGGGCTLDQGFQTFVYLARWGMGILGSVALLFFVIGGVIWLTSGGNTEKIQKGRSILVNTTIGMIIVLGAWIFVNFILTSLNQGSEVPIDISNGGVQTLEDLCENVDNPSGDEDNPEFKECAGVLGVCSDNKCVSRCELSDEDKTIIGESSLIGKSCNDIEDCSEDSIVYNKCRGGQNIVCCETSTDGN